MSYHRQDAFLRPPELACSGCGDEMFPTEDYRADTDDPLYCVSCLRDKVRGRCLLAQQAIKLGDIYRAERAWEDAWAWVKERGEVRNGKR